VKRTALWIVGAPAVGKTTLARALLGPRPYTLIGPPKWTCAGRTIAAGHYEGKTFDGADSVPYNGVLPALYYWQVTFAPVVTLTIFDGDRFSYTKAVEFVRAHVDRVACVYVAAPSCAELERRRAERNWNPDPRWLKGRDTKAKRFAISFTDCLCVADDALERTRAFIEQRPYIEPRIDL